MQNNKTISSNRSPVDQFNIIERHFFFDKVQFWTRRKLTTQELNIIRQNAKCRRTKFTKDERKTKKPYMAQLGWHYRYLLLQPRQPALRYLQELLGNNVLINYVEPAVELITDTKETKRRLHEFLELHWWQPWRSKRQVGCDYHGTIYSGNRRARNRTACYADKPSKITGDEHCCKPEWRINGRAACKAKGLIDFTALMKFDHVEFWRTNLRLGRIDTEKLERDIDRKNGRGPRYLRNHPRNVYHRSRAKILLRAANCRGLSGSRSYKQLGAVQDIRSGWRSQRYNLRNYLVSMSNHCILGIGAY